MMPELSGFASLQWLDMLGIGVFAISGALVAAQLRGNFVTFAFFAALTGMGGGTLRDLLIGAPVFWVGSNVWLLICLSAALLVWVFGKTKSAPGLLLWFDAVGLVAYAVYGTEKALQYEIAPVPACVMGIMTACAGGIVRDIIAESPSVVLRPEIYVTAAALTASLYVTTALLGVPPFFAALAAVLVGFSVRGAAIRWGIGLPAFRGRAS